MKTLLHLDIPVTVGSGPSRKLPGLTVVQTARVARAGVERTFYAAASPLVLIRCDGFTLADALAARYAEASVGYDPGLPDYVLAANAGQRHLKITLRRPAAQSFSAEAGLARLSALVAAAPLPLPRFDSEVLMKWVVDSFSQRTASLPPETLRSHIDIITRAANGETLSASEKAAGREAVESVLDALRQAPVGQSALDEAFWRSPGGAAIGAAVRQLYPLVSITQTARMLGYGEGPRALMRVRRLIQQGRLRAFVDPAEPNPRRATRIDRASVETLLRSAR